MHCEPNLLAPSSISIGFVIALVLIPTLSAPANKRFLMSSKLLTPNGKVMESEAAHGTVTRHYRLHQQGQETSTNPIASIYAWTGGLRHRGELDGNEKLVNFADTLDSVCVRTVEEGNMTKDLALLVGPEQNWLTSKQFFDKIDDNLQKIMG
jgi:isocitrate dehydrogenase